MPARKCKLNYRVYGLEKLYSFITLFLKQVRSRTYHQMTDNADSKTLRQVASLLGASGVTLGAFGAHALKDKLTQRNMLTSWNTAILYQLFHATAVLGISALCAASETGVNDANKSATLARAGKFMAVGNVLFSGSIYMLCIGVGPKYILGPTTPIGGLCMIGGWVLLGLS